MGFESTQVLVMPLAVGAIAFLYASIGHGGATGYLGMAALVGIAPAFARPGALWMNCVVAGLAFWRFRNAGCFDGRIFVPLAAASIPCAWLGSRMHLDHHVYSIFLAVALLATGIFLIRGKSESSVEQTPNPLHWPFAMLAGATLGFLAGLTGIGGGVFLTPLLVLLHWTSTRTAAGISALFILVNSVAGLLGLGSAALVWHPVYFWAVILGTAGAICGAYWGVHSLRAQGFRYALALVLWIAATKLVITGK